MSPTEDRQAVRQHLEDVIAGNLAARRKAADLFAQRFRKAAQRSQNFLLQMIYDPDAAVDVPAFIEEQKRSSTGAHMIEGVVRQMLTVGNRTVLDKFFSNDLLWLQGKTYGFFSATGSLLIECLERGHEALAEEVLLAVSQKIPSPPQATLPLHPLPPTATARRLWLLTDALAAAMSSEAIHAVTIKSLTQIAERILTPEEKVTFYAALFARAELIHAHELGVAVMDWQFPTREALADFLKTYTGLFARRNAFYVDNALSAIYAFARPEDRPWLKQVRDKHIDNHPTMRAVLRQAIERDENISTSDVYPPEDKTAYCITRAQAESEMILYHSANTEMRDVYQVTPASGWDVSRRARLSSESVQIEEVLMHFFGSYSRFLDYVALWAPRGSLRPLHDLAQPFAAFRPITGRVPRERREEWIAAVQKFGPRMAKLCPFALEVAPNPLGYSATVQDLAKLPLWPAKLTRPQIKAAIDMGLPRQVMEETEALMASATCRRAGGQWQCPDIRILGPAFGMGRDVVFRRLDNDDIRVPHIGQLTGCCLHLRGAAASLAKHITTSRDGALYALERTRPDGQKEILGIAPAFLSRDNVLIFDALRILDKSRMGDTDIRRLLDTVGEYLSDRAGRHSLKGLWLGNGFETAHMRLGYAPAPQENVEARGGENFYRDSKAYWEVWSRASALRPQLRTAPEMNDPEPL